MQQKEWDEKHIKYSDAEWINKPTIFATQITSFFPKTGRILDIGCGQGQDSRFFAELGYDVTGVDFSNTGIEFAKKKSKGNKYKNLTFDKVDISQKLPFPDSSFDVAYSHLAIHYFDDNKTKEIIGEISRILKKGGVFACLVNSIHDPEYNTGEKIGDNYFLIRETKKHFFSKETLEDFLANFKTIVLDENGETYRDRAINTKNLVRFVGLKL